MKKLIFVDPTQKIVEKPESEQVHWRMSGYAVIQDEEGKVLMIQPAWNKQWELPGGGAQIDESIQEGMIRECFEETGYRVEPISTEPIHVGEQYFYGPQSKKFFHAVHITYLAKLASDEQDISAINPEGWIENEKMEWVDINSLNETNCHPIHYPTIKLLQQESL